MTLEADNVNMQVLDMGYIVIDTDGVSITELISKVVENGYSFRMMNGHDSTETPATYTSPHQLL